MDEAEAVRRCQEGDELAFPFLVERYTRLLYGTAYQITRDPGLAEDLVQEAFLRAWRNMPSLRDSGNFKAWLVRILVNHAASQLRKKRVPEAPLEDEVFMRSDGQEVETAVLQAAERQRIRLALETLPQEQRQAVVLRYYTHLTVPEIARALGCREGTVKSRLHRACARLREVLLAGEAVPEQAQEVP